MRSNLMTAMGLGEHQNQFALPHRPSRTPTTQTQQQELESQDQSPPTPISDDSVETRACEAGASFASKVSSNDSRSGPTPKRARPRKFKVPSPAKARLSAAAGSRTTRSTNAGQNTVKRQPLLTVNANRSPAKSADRKTLSLAMQENMDETTFDGSEPFTGTPAGKMHEIGDIID